MNDEHNPHTSPAGPPPVAPGGEHDEEASSKKVLVGILAILLGGLGIHKFVLGYTTPGIIMLAVYLVGIGGACLVFPVVLAIAVQIVGLIEGIIYLTKSDEEFVATYIENKKGWF